MVLFHSHRWISKAVVVALLLVAFFSFTLKGYTAMTPAAGANAVLVADCDTGEVIYQRNADKSVAPASTTKIMTALLTIENVNLQKVVEVPQAAEGLKDGINLRTGEKMRIIDLLHGLLIASADDTAIVLAHAVSGSVEKFAEKMNQKAKELGCKNTTFKNPNGIDEAGHQSTAYDLFIMSNEFMKNKLMRKIVTKLQYTIPATNKSGVRVLQNHNRLLFDTNHNVEVFGQLRPAYYEGALGLKTGDTVNAGACLISMAKRHGVEVCSVVMGTSKKQRFAASIETLDHAFEKYALKKIVKKGEKVAKLKVLQGESDKVDIKVKGSKAIWSLKNAKKLGIYKKVVLKKAITAPVKAGTKVGKLKIYRGGAQIGTLPLVTAGSIDKKKEPAWHGVIIFIIKIIVSILIAMMFIVFILRIWNKRKRKKRALMRERALQRQRKRYPRRIKRM